MTIDEAIKNMESHIAAYESNLRSIASVNSINKDWDGKSAMGQPITTEDKIYKYTTDSIEACRMAIEALEKQIPTKLLKQTVNGLNGSFKRYKCPHCKATMTYDQRHNSFCTECGQFLDWD